MFDKKKIKKSLIVLILIAIIIIAIILLRRTLARYETTAKSDKDVDVAFWILDNDFKSPLTKVEKNLIRGLGSTALIFIVYIIFFQKCVV